MKPRGVNHPRRFYCHYARQGDTKKTVNGDKDIRGTPEKPWNWQ